MGKGAGKGREISVEVCELSESESFIHPEEGWTAHGGAGDFRLRFPGEGVLYLPAAVGEEVGLRDLLKARGKRGSSGSFLRGKKGG